MNTRAKIKRRANRMRQQGITADGIFAKELRDTMRDPDSYWPGYDNRGEEMEIASPYNPDFDSSQPISDNNLPF